MSQSKKRLGIPLAIVIAGALMSAAILYSNERDSEPSSTATQDSADLEAQVLPTDGVVIPARWGDLGKQMVDAGVIDAAKFTALYEGRGGLNEEQQALLTGESNGKLRITKENAGYVLNLLWALGLGNQNNILDEGPMQEYGDGPGGFASTGGWSVSAGNPMDHYSAYAFITLTAAEQTLVEEVSKNIYRPCCGNSTFFPDCNHGMAMLGLLELMASQGASEDQMYEAALQVNAYWFPSQYLTLARYYQKQGTEWADVDPKEVLGTGYSGAAGYKKVLSEVQPVQSQGGGGCSV